VVTALADRLAARTLELVDIPSQSGHEDAIREHVLRLVPSGWTAEYAGDEAFLYVSPRRDGFPLIVLAAHYDTVPAQGNVPGRVTDGEVHGLGASDMKGGLAVALELARDLDLGPATCDLALLLFGREELPAEHNPLPALFAGSAAVHETTLAVVLEPTDFLVIDGSGSSVGPARPYAAVGVFVDADPMLRMSRGLARDGDTYRPHWQRWAAQEDAIFAADDTSARADLVIDTTRRGLRSAGWNQPT